MNFNPDKIKNILVVKQHNQLGDMLCTLPLLAAIKKRLPGSHITLIGSPVNYSVFNTESEEYIDEVLLYDKFDLKGLIKFFRKLRKRKYDLGIVPSTVSISRTSHIINFSSGARIKSGVKSLNGMHNKYDYLLNDKLDFDWRGNRRHQQDKNLDFIKHLGFELSGEEINNIKFRFSESETEFASEKMRKFFPDKNKLIIGLHPGAGKPGNRWDVKNFAEIVKKLNEKFNCYFFSISGPMDEEVSKEFRIYLKEHRAEIAMFENFHIREAASVVSRSNLYITNDTGIMHVAGYTGVKVLSLFGETNGYEWAPRRKGCEYIQSETNNINDIKVDTVFERANNLLNC